MIRQIPIYVAAVAISLALGGPAGAAVSNGFGIDSEGWDVITAGDVSAAPIATYGAVHNAAGGNPGGYISILDPDDQNTYFRAPAAYLGNMGPALGGVLRFDQIVSTPSLDYDTQDVVLKGGGLTLTYNLPLPAQTDVWKTITVPLGPNAAWTLNGGAAASLADFQTVLGNLGDLWILAEYTNGLIEITGIDNVQLAEAVPEPGTLLLMVSAVGLAGLARRRGS